MRIQRGLSARPLPVSATIVAEFEGRLFKRKGLARGFRVVRRGVRRSCWRRPAIKCSWVAPRSSLTPHCLTAAVTHPVARIADLLVSRWFCDRSENLPGVLLKKVTSPRGPDPSEKTRSRAPGGHSDKIKDWGGYHAAVCRHRARDYPRNRSQHAG